MSHLSSSLPSDSSAGEQFCCGEGGENGGGGDVKWRLGKLEG